MKSPSSSHNNLRYCEKRSDVAIQFRNKCGVAATCWIASSCRATLAVLAMTVTLLGALSACKPDATPRAQDAKNWIDKFYTRYTIRGGWGFFGAETRDKNVVVEVNVPERQAEELMAFGDKKRLAFIVRNTCPPKDEEVWSILDHDGDVIIHTRLNGNSFAEVACRDNL